MEDKVKYGKKNGKSVQKLRQMGHSVYKLMQEGRIIYKWLYGKHGQRVGICGAYRPEGKDFFVLGGCKCNNTDDKFDVCTAYDIMMDRFTKGINGENVFYSVNSRVLHNLDKLVERAQKYFHCPLKED